MPAGSQEAERAKDVHAAARSKIAIGMHALDDCAYEKALKLSSEACRGFEITGDEERRLDALEKIGKAQMLLGQYDLSLETLTRHCDRATARAPYGRVSCIIILQRFPSTKATFRQVLNTAFCVTHA